MSPIDPTALEWFDRPEWGAGYRETARILLHEAPTWDAEVHFVDIGDGVPRAMGHMHWWHHTTATLREVKALWPSIRARIDGPLFTMAENDSPALDRFRERYGGFVFLNDIPCTDGTTRRLYVHYGHAK